MLVSSEVFALPSTGLSSWSIKMLSFFTLNSKLHEVIGQMMMELQFTSLNSSVKYWNHKRISFKTLLKKQTQVPSHIDWIF